MANVSIHDLEVAHEWLLNNEGEDGESEACERVAGFIAAEIARRRVKSVVRVHRVSPRLAREVLRRVGAIA